MADPLLLLIVVLLLAVAFDFINGFHDTANAIATVVATRVLTPTQAILMAAILNFAGAMTGTAVAKTISKGLIDAHLATQPLIIAALLAAIVWNLITWFYGIPSSSSHALIGGIVGAAIAEASSFSAPKWGTVVEKVLIPLVVSPIIGFAMAWAIMIVLLRMFIRRTPGGVQRTFGKLQLVSSAFMAFSHGGNDAQKTMGVMTLAIASYMFTTQGVPIPADPVIPLWVKLAAAIAMGLGTAAGGWRVIKTMGHKLARLQPIHGFAAETAAATIIEIASRFGFPLSTTHVISSSIMGAGASRGLSAVRWNVAGNIVTAWILTIPACMALAAGFFFLLRVLLRLP
ncbi:MAG: inorganic phosphate transporter, PiT family [Abditibacteriota bacterium]|nr:inorganic phosphate transporter, PiT family [Abditibacteriota bacterium]